MKSFLIVFSFSTFLISSSYAQAIDIRKLDSLFDILEKHELATGSLAISLNGKMVYQKAIGFIMLDSNKKREPDIYTKYRIGSVSKIFTAAMIFQLLEEGKVSLNEKLATWFPQLPAANKITIREMLYHRSGLHDYTRNTDYPEWMHKPKTQEEMLSIIAGKGSDFEPGFKADYCNSNFLLLSYIIERVDKMSYAQAVEKRITSKIGLKDTYYGKPINTGKNEAASYKYADGFWKKEKETDLGIHGGAGSLVSTASNLVVFIQHLSNGRLISQASLDSMTTIVDGYGMGIFPFDFGNTKGYGHGGRIEEFYSWTGYYPDKKLAISYITNGILYPRTDILNGIRKICFSSDYTIPFSKPVVLKDSELDSYAGTYSSADLPFKVNCSKDNQQLIFSMAGKTMETKPVSPNYFMNLKTGSFFEFNPGKGELQIKETDNIYYLKKEE